MRNDESDSEASTTPAPQAKRPKSPNYMNKLIVSGWNSAPGANDDREKEKEKEKEKIPGAKRDRTVNGEPARKKRKQETAVTTTPPTHVNLEDLGGIDSVVDQLERLLILPLTRPGMLVERKATIPQGILLFGPPGCGKTALVHAIASACEKPFIEIDGPSIVSGVSGESEQKIREHFEEAKRLAPSILFIDEIDSIASKRETSQSDMGKRMVTQMLSSMDDLHQACSEGKPVMVIAATNRPDSLDPALRRGGRFSTEINIGVPDERVREQILRALTRGQPLSSDVDLKVLAKQTPGFVGADLRDLVDKAVLRNLDRFLKAMKDQVIEADDEMEVEGQAINKPGRKAREFKLLFKRSDDLSAPDPPGFESTDIDMNDFLAAKSEIQPTSKREGFTTVPDTTWSDIGGLDGIREELEMAIVLPIKDPELFKGVGITTPTGVLLLGPPGCGKTLVAKAVANASDANFISVKGPELLNKVKLSNSNTGPTRLTILQFVGESERAVRQVFTRARSSVPCVLFFDELDALVPKRDDGLSDASARVVNTLLTELDGLSDRDGIYVIAATNRPDIIDPAMLRPGRLERLLYIGLPGPTERVSILRAVLDKTPIDSSMADIAEKCDNFSGADLAALQRRAAEMALRRRVRTVERPDFERAIETIRPSVTDVAKYQRMKIRYGSGLAQSFPGN
jgi:ribosome biogenesis ATPase